LNGEISIVFDMDDAPSQYIALDHEIGHNLGLEHEK
jgi:hypothetical protein